MVSKDGCNTLNSMKWSISPSTVKVVLEYMRLEAAGLVSTPYPDATTIIPCRELMVSNDYVTSIKKYIKRNLNEKIRGH